MMDGGDGWGWGMVGSGWISILIVCLIAVGIAIIVHRRHPS